MRYKLFREEMWKEMSSSKFYYELIDTGKEFMDQFLVVTKEL